MKNYIIGVFKRLIEVILLAILIPLYFIGVVMETFIRIILYIFKPLYYIITGDSDWGDFFEFEEYISIKCITYIGDFVFYKILKNNKED